MKKSDLFQNDIHQRMIAKFFEMEEEVILKVLTALLKREPVIEDAQYCEKLYRDGFPDQYEFAYKGVILGTVIFTTDLCNFKNETNPFIGIKFIPKPE